MTPTQRKEAEELLALRKALYECKCTAHDRWGATGDAIGRCEHERRFEQASERMADWIAAQLAAEKQARNALMELMDYCDHLRSPAELQAKIAKLMEKTP